MTMIVSVVRFYRRTFLKLHGKTVRGPQIGEPPLLFASRHFFNRREAFARDNGFERQQPAPVVGRFDAFSTPGRNVTQCIGQKLRPFAPTKSPLPMERHRERKHLGVPGLKKHRPSSIAGTSSPSGTSKAVILRVVERDRDSHRTNRSAACLAPALPVPKVRAPRSARHRHAAGEGQAPRRCCRGVRKLRGRR